MPEQNDAGVPVMMSTCGIFNEGIPDTPGVRS